MIILMGIALTILCICSIMELALLSLCFLKSSKLALLKNKSGLSIENSLPAESAHDAFEEESLQRARKRYEEELLAFQDLLNYNADVAYGIDSQRGEE